MAKSISFDCQNLSFYNRRFFDVERVIEIKNGESENLLEGSATSRRYKNEQPPSYEVIFYT